MAEDLRCKDGGRHVWIMGSCWKCNVPKNKYTAAKRVADSRKCRERRAKNR